MTWLCINIMGFSTENCTDNFLTMQCFWWGKPESSDSFVCYFLIFQPPKRCRTSTPGNSDTLLQDSVPLVLDLRLALVSNFPDIDAFKHPKDGPEEALKTQPIIIRLQMIHYPSARHHKTSQEKLCSN